MLLATGSVLLGATLLASCGWIDTGAPLSPSQVVGTWTGGGSSLVFTANGAVTVNKIDLSAEQLTNGQTCGVFSGTGSWSFESNTTTQASRGIFVDIELSGTASEICDGVTLVSAPGEPNPALCLFLGGNVCSGPVYVRTSRSLSEQ